MSYEEIGKKLSDILFLIQEADDVVCNKIDALKGIYINRLNITFRRRIYGKHQRFNLAV